MKIEKYKKMAAGKYKITLSNREIILYEEVILKYNLLLKKEITEKELCEIDIYNQEWDVYYVALNSLKRRYKSVFEMTDFLRKKEYPNDLIRKAIDKLCQQGYLNDQNFTKSYINSQMTLTMKGPLKIKRELLEKGIEEKIIEEEINVFSIEEQKEKVNKLIDKMLRLNKTRGGVVLKQKISTDLRNLGYSNELINELLDKKDIKNNEEIAKKEYDKLYRKLSRKYKDKELEYKIKEKLYQKGLYYED